MNLMKDKIEGNRKVNCPINGAEARALEAAAAHLDPEFGPTVLGARDKKRVASHLHRVAARYRLRDRVS